jgi:hypothetical protein
VSKRVHQHLIWFHLSLHRGRLSTCDQRDEQPGTDADENTFQSVRALAKMLEGLARGDIPIVHD